MSDLRFETSEASRIYVEENTVTKIYVGETKVYPQGGYYDCGYGCQYYTYNPGCIECSPTCYSYHLYNSCSSQYGYDYEYTNCEGVLTQINIPEFSDYWIYSKYLINNSEDGCIIVELL